MPSMCIVLVWGHTRVTPGFWKGKQKHLKIKFIFDLVYIVRSRSCSMRPWLGTGRRQTLRFPFISFIISLSPKRSERADVVHFTLNSYL